MKSRLKWSAAKADSFSTKVLTLVRHARRTAIPAAAQPLVQSAQTRSISILLTAYQVAQVVTSPILVGMCVRHVKQTAMLAAIRPLAHSAETVSISMLLTAYQVAQLPTMEVDLAPLVAHARP